MDAEDVGLDEEDIELRGLVRDFVEREARPAAAEYEARGEDPAQVYRTLGALGLAGIPFDAAFGGSARPYRSYLLLIEELARAWVALAIGLGVHTLVCDAIQRFGDPALKEGLLAPMLAGERFGAYALTESSSGSDAAALRTRAVRSNGRHAPRRLWGLPPAQISDCSSSGRISCETKS